MIEIDGSSPAVTGGGLPNVVQVASHATGGAGTAGSPYTGWEGALASPAPGTSFFFDGYFTTSQQLNFDLSQNIELRGVDGYLAQAPYTATMGTVGVPASQITFTANNPASWISAKYSWGFRINGITLKNTSVGFTGVLVDFGGTDPDITVGVRCENVNFDDSTNVGNSLACVSLDNNVESSFRQCAFYGGQYGVIGSRLGPWSNAIRLEQCRFIGSTKAPIKNPAAQWTIDSCIIEPMSGAVAQASFIYADQAVYRLDVRSCYMWDAVGGSPVFKMTGINWGVSIIGNQLNSIGAAQPIFSAGTYEGLVFTGNMIDSGATAGGNFYDANPQIHNALIAGNSVAISAPAATDNASAIVTGGYLTKSLVVDTTGVQLQPKPFDPTTVAGLKLWLKADGVLYQDSARTTLANADTNPVGSWSDVSGLAHHLSQATAGSRPILKLAIQNGLPVVRFDGVDDFLSIVAASLTVAQPDTIFMVVKAAVANTVLNLFDSNSGNRQLAQGDGTAGDHYRVYAGAGPNTGAGSASFGAFHVHVYQFNGAASLARVDGGVLIATNNPGANSLTGMNLGANVVPGSYWNGDIAEVLVYDSALSLANIQSVEAYLKARWGTP